MKREVIRTDASLPATRRSRFGRLVRIGAFAIVGLLVVKVAMVVLSTLVSMAVFATLVGLTVAAVAIMLRR